MRAGLSLRNRSGGIMRKIRVWVTLGCCLFAVAAVIWAQALRKAGLWEMTANMTWQQSPLPPGVNLPPGMKSPFSGNTTTTQVCLSQQMIDKYGAPMPQSHNDCQITNVVMKSNSMTADMVCSGKTNGRGTIESSWTDGNHARGKVHFAGTMQMGPNTTPIEWSVESTSVFKGSDCGSVKPLPMPNN
jgi:hypothetical protein